MGKEEKILEQNKLDPALEAAGRQNRRIDKTDWFSFQSSFDRLRPFFEGMLDLKQALALLCEILCEEMRLLSIGLALTHFDGWECAQWSAQKGVAEASLEQALKALLPAQAGDADFARLVCELQEQFPRLWLCPLFDQEQKIGLAMFAKSPGDGDWTQSEKETLGIFQQILSLFAVNRLRGENHRLHSFVYNSMMDSMNANLYITDVETDRILFMNKTMKKTFGLEHPEGERCWKVLQRGMEHRCEFCPVDLLKHGLDEKKEMPSYIWEENNTINGRVYENYDSLIRWLDGSVVHMQQSIDVTDSRLLSRAALTDELTDMLNRRGGKNALVPALARAAQERVPVTVALFDINCLKEINDLYGHAEGDRAITLTASAIKGCMSGEDFPFRLSGDEFVAVFYGKDQKTASRLISQAQERLKAQKERERLPFALSFCYGLQEIMPGQEVQIHELLMQADEKMYEQKRRFHIQRAEEKRFSQAPEHSDKSVKNFTYDKERLYDALVQSTDDYIYICNMKTNTFRYPKAMIQEFDLPAEVIENAAAVWGAKVHPHDKQAFLESNQEITDGRTDLHQVEYRALNRKGEWVWMRCRGHLERDENGEPTLFAGIITNLEKKNKMDHMTGLFNKFEFEEELKRLISSKATTSLGVMLLNMDDFSHINNLHNREFGDEVIRITAQKIQTMLPKDASIYRMDGDEFGIVVNNGDQDALLQIFGQIRNIFRHQQEYNGKKYYCTLSAGCAMYPQDAVTYLDLVKFADYSLEYSKNNGKNRIAFFSQEILTHKTRALDLTELLRESVEHDFAGFTLFYQPQVEAATGKVVGAEALARWSCEKYGAVSPMEFIPLLEQSGLIVPAGKWIFQQAVRQCRAWCEKNREFVISVNLSYLQLQDGDFIPFMKKELKSAALAPHNLVVELTESYLVKSSESVKRLFHEIRSLGMRIAMDDFGTGYSSLGILKNSPADIVKIDKTFIRDIKNSSFDATFIRFIVALCHDVNIHVCLEGVETDEEYRIVSSMGLDTIQGYLFGRPVSAKEFERNFLNGDFTTQNSR